MVCLNRPHTFKSSKAIHKFFCLVYLNYFVLHVKDYRHVRICLQLARLCILQSKADTPSAIDLNNDLDGTNNWLFQWKMDST